MADLDDLSTTFEELQKLRAESKAHKGRAARHSEDLLRARKEIGSLRKQLEQIPALQAENDLLVQKNQELSTQLQAAHRTIAEAEAKSARDAAKVNAYDRFAELFGGALTPREK